MKSRRTVAALVAAAASLSTPAYGQEPQSPDPDDGTPAAAQYEIPVDNARKDAAPRTVSRGSEPGGLGSGSTNVPAGSPPGATTSRIRSDNGFNTSATVPGAEASERARKEKGEKGGNSGGAAEGDARGSVQGPATAPTVDTEFTPLASTEPGSVRSALLLLLAAMVGGGVGLAARRARRF